MVGGTNGTIWDFLGFIMAQPINTGKNLGNYGLKFFWKLREAGEVIGSLSDAQLFKRLTERIHLLYKVKGHD